MPRISITPDERERMAHGLTARDPRAHVAAEGGEDRADDELEDVEPVGHHEGSGIAGAAAEDHHDDEREERRHREHHREIAAEDGEHATQHGEPPG
jgi:hypothetical protein